MPLRAHRDEGLALVVALVVTLLVFLLTTAILADAFHNVVGSANARERLTAINAAEAGVSWYSRALESAGLTSLRGSPNWGGSGNTYSTLTPKTVTGMPGVGTFTLTATYYMKSDYVNASDALVSCPACPTFQTIDNTTAPSKFRVELTAIGQAGSVTRTVRSVMELRPLHATINGAFAGIYICELGNRFTITGPYADVYLLADSPSDDSGCRSGTGGSTTPLPVLVVNSGQFTTSGDVYIVKGGVELSNTTKIDGDLWANGQITLGSGAQQSGNGGGQAATQCSSTNNASILICGNVTSVNYSPVIRQTARVLGTWGQCVGCSLPDLNFPIITLEEAYATFPAGSWTQLTSLSAGFFSTSVASGFSHTLIKLACAGGSPYVMPKGTLNLTGDVAIVSPCGFQFQGRVDVRPARGISGAPTLYLITGHSASCPDTSRDILFQQNFDASAVRTFVYTPCKLSFTNQTNLTGQLLARTLYAQGRTTINTVDLLGLSSTQPGYVSGFQSRVLVIREI